MIYRLPMAVLLAALPYLAQSADRLENESRTASDSCPPLLTETECRAHHRILTALAEPQERNAYLTMHQQLLDERKALCGCTQAMNSVGLLHN
jgi:hypothetical protein